MRRMARLSCSIALSGSPAKVSGLAMCAIETGKLLVSFTPALSPRSAKRIGQQGGSITRVRFSLPHSFPCCGTLIVT